MDNEFQAAQNSSFTSSQGHDVLNEDIEDRPLIFEASNQENTSTRRLVVNGSYSPHEQLEDEEPSASLGDDAESNNATDLDESTRFGIKSIEKRHTNKLFLIRNKYEMGEMAGNFAIFLYIKS